VKGVPNYRKLSAEQVEEIVERRERGWSYERLAERFGVAPGAIHYHCLKHGAVSPRQRKMPIPTAPKSRVLKDGRVQRCFTQDEDARLLELEATGMPISAICKELGRARTSVCMRLMTLALREDLPEFEAAR
jgi:transposase-like protein